jgi:4a-hydroxytetrahydrobiopterin dehydratase
MSKKALGKAMPVLEYRKLSPSEVESELGTIPGWTVADTRIERSFEFERYQEGLVFANAVGYLADKLNHHPDLAVGYGRVIVSVTTHATEGLSPYDFELARRINSII